MKKVILQLLHHLNRAYHFSRNKKYLLLILAIISALDLFYINTRQKAKYLLALANTDILNDRNFKVKRIINELVIEANFMQNVSFLKHKDKGMDKKCKSRDNLIQIFNSTVFRDWLHKLNITKDRFFLALNYPGQDNSAN